MSGYGDMVKGAFASKSGVKAKKKKVEVSELVLTEAEADKLLADVDKAELEASYKANHNINLILDEAIARNETLQKQLKSQKMHYAKIKNRLSHMSDKIASLRSHSDAILHSTICIALFAIFEFVVIMLS